MNCRCGRPLYTPKPHCPYCGSTYLYSKASAGEKVNGKWAVGFHCRNCGRDFHEMTACEAPEVQIKSKHKDPIRRLMEPETIEQVQREALETLEKLRKEREKQDEGNTGEAGNEDPEGPLQ